jgi:anti-sigma-K factor RskA
MSDHEELEAMVAPWVLGALDEAEAEGVRSHVQGCASCREVAGRLRRVAGALPLAAEEVAPPARLRARVLAAASATRPETPFAARPPRPAPRRVPPALATRMPAYAMAAVAVVALLLGVIVGQVALRSAPQPQVARHTLTGHQDLAGARATVVDLRSDGVVLVDFAGLPSPGAGRVYEVWLIPAKGSPVAAAVFVPDANGARTVLINRSLSGYAEMAVTNEAGPDGAPAPTQQPQLYGSLA